MLGGDESGKYFDAALLNRIVVIPPAKSHAAIFDDAESAALRPILGMKLLEEEDAMGNAAHLRIVIGRCHVIEEQDRTLPVGQELFEREDLSPVPQRVAREQA